MLFCGDSDRKEAKEEERLSAKSRSQMSGWRRSGAAASGEGKSIRVADLYGVSF
jgi:hypothetical protein